MLVASAIASVEEAAVSTAIGSQVFTKQYRWGGEDFDQSKFDD